MPQIFVKKIPIFSEPLSPAAKIGVWKIEEDEDFFLSKMPLSDAEFEDISKLRGIRKLEWLACRWLLHEISGFEIRLPLAKDAFSKPFFEEKEHLICSLSHSRGVVAALFLDLDDLPDDRHENFSCGCDLQKLVEKMDNLAPKFVRPDEFEWVNSKKSPRRRHELLHFFWTAKESLYKAWGKKELDFRGNLRLSDFKISKNGKIYATGHIEKGAANLTFDVFSEMILVENFGEFVLTWCFPKG